MGKEPVAKLHLGQNSRFCTSDSHESKIAYSQLSMSIFDSVDPMAESSNFGSKASFASGPEEVLLSARLGDDLNWEQALEKAKRLVSENRRILWVLDLGLERADFDLEDEMAFQAASVAIRQFCSCCLVPGVDGVVLYRGRLDLSLADSMAAWLRMGAALLPEDLSIFLDFDVTGMSRIDALSLSSPERFEHFEVRLSPEVRIFGKDPSLGICIPEADAWEEVEKILKKLDEEKRSYRVVYEAFLTEQWDGLDEILVLEEVLSARGLRKLKGFLASGGRVIKVGAEGFEPPAYWSQTSRASQAALCPEDRMESL